jgi:hypothetical protein
VKWPACFGSRSEHAAGTIFVPDACLLIAGFLIRLSPAWWS